MLIVVGLGGAVFCLKQAQNWNEVKDEQLPKYESLKDILKRGSAANTNVQHVMKENGAGNAPTETTGKPET